MPNGSKPAPVIPKRWQRLIGSPLVQDTLRTLLGGSLPVTRAAARPRTIPPDVAAQVLRPDTVEVYVPDANETQFMHELGHVADFRGVAPEVVQRIQGHYTPMPGTYAAHGPREHTAEAFARAFAARRNGFADSTQANKDVPGAIEFVRWLQQQPILRKGT